MELEDLIKYILSEHRFLHEFRLQKLVYLVELTSQCHNEDTLTDAEFKPYMYGAYSEDISNKLDNIDSGIRKSVDKRHGELTNAYHWEGSEGPSVEDSDLIDRVIQAVRSKSNDELASWSKETGLFENTPYGEPMKFSDYYDEEKERLRQDLRKEFPELLEEGQ